MSQKITFYPVGNADSCLLELSNNKKMLFDFANYYTGKDDDKRTDLVKELKKCSSFDVVQFSHAHDDHVKGSKDFFYLDHAKKYQGEGRKIITELWVSSAFILDTDIESEDVRVIRQEARHRLKEGYGIKVFSEPESLSDWLKENDIEPDERKDFIVHAGTLLKCTNLGKEIEIFVHAPFSADSEEATDKNEPSIVLQLRLTNDEHTTKILMTGDSKYSILEHIVDVSKANGNEEYLHWDIYKIPHHCSYTGLASEKGETRTTPIPQVQELLKLGNEGAVLIASCDPITSDTSPPHIQAKRAYKHYSDNKTLWATMEYPPNTKSPKPLRYEIDELGISELKHFASPAISSPAPRAG
ncbi:MAG: hypothetical protein FWD90_02665 [Defluviitaleaceae bacterium]|nr:hypothetical protein [Defluviitaleaceae bacterium]